MDSAIAKAIRPPFEPVALLLTDQAPHPAKAFAEGRWGCVMWLLASAARGTPAVADRRSFGCLGGGTGLGFGNQYENWPGGIECFYRFLADGNDSWAEGRTAADTVRPGFRKESFASFVHGERYLKSAEQARAFVTALPITEVPARYVVFKPLSQVADGERPEIIIFLVDPDRLAALVVLANYARDDNENVIIPFAAGCQSIGLLAYREARRPRPRAVVGLMDISARAYVAAQLGRELVTFAVPLAMFEEMEANVAGSFLERDTWHRLLTAPAR
ncbi:MAG: DUF169 domain-containing protein [Acidobacteriota bacterium]